MTALRLGSRLKRARSGGYTVVEVLSAMTLFAIGAAGVISMQRVTIQGGDDARRMDIATGLANEWSGRFQRDAAFWQNDANRLTDTLYIKNIPSTDNNPTAWLDAGAADIFGRDRPAGSGDHLFCAQYQLAWIQQPQNPYRPGEMLRVQIRIYWSRLDNAPILDCAAPPLPPDDANAPNYYHFVYLTTAVRSSPPPQ